MILDLSFAPNVNLNEGRLGHEFVKTNKPQLMISFIWNWPSTFDNVKLELNDNKGFKLSCVVIQFNFAIPNDNDNCKSIGQPQVRRGKRGNNQDHKMIDKFNKASVIKIGWKNFKRHYKITHVLENFRDSKLTARLIASIRKVELWNVDAIRKPSIH